MAAASQTSIPVAAECRRLLVRQLDLLPDVERAFVHLYGESQNAFWLDSSIGGERGRFSFIGDDQGPLGAVISYGVGDGQVRVERGEEIEVREESIFAYLDRVLPGLRPLYADLPFDFDCGFAGYFGYELKADCDGDAAHRAPTPDAAFIFADRLIAFDHEERRTYLLTLTGIRPELHQLLHLADREVDAVRLTSEGERWIEETSERLVALPPLAEPAPGPGSVELRLRRSPERYRDDIEACKRYLTAGHSYEICLTNKLVAKASSDPLELYRALRRANPAPFASYLRFGDLAVLSSSPERFLAVDRNGWAEARPIKGRERDDRRSAPQRSRSRLRGRHRERARADAGRDV
jgi:para-aminobenzoate synthetase